MAACRPSGVSTIPNGVSVRGKVLSIVSVIELRTVSAWPTDEITKTSVPSGEVLRGDERCAGTDNQDRGQNEDECLHGSHHCAL